MILFIGGFGFWILRKNLEYISSKSRQIRR